MKNILIVTVCVLIGLAVVTGCQKSASTTNYSMDAIIAGKPTIFNNCFVSAGYNSITGSASNYVIEGLSNSSNFPYIMLSVPAIKDTTYYISGTTVSNYAKYFVDTVTTKYAASGIVVIASVSPYVIGSYSFTCTDGTTITQGTFIAKPLN